MKYILEESRTYDLMVKFFEKNYPNIRPPLIVHRRIRQANSGYGSFMHDYTYINTYYFNEENDDDALFTEYDDRFDSSDTKWYVSNQLEMIYDFFGEELFEKFVKEYFGLDISKKGNKKYNWLFN